MTTKKKTTAKPASTKTLEARIVELEKVSVQDDARLATLEHKFGALAEHLDAYIIAGDKTLVDHGKRLNALEVNLAAVDGERKQLLATSTDVAATNATTREAFQAALKEEFRTAMVGGLLDHESELGVEYRAALRKAVVEVIVDLRHPRRAKR